MRIVDCKVVVVEDDPVISWHLSRQLQACSCQSVVYFESKREVLIYLVTERADLMITNLKLFDGWANKDYLEFLDMEVDKLLILTGLRDENLQPDLENLMDPFFLYKPFTALQLKNCIENLCDNQWKV
jgi:DNA-binding NtrC family response regulator